MRTWGVPAREPTSPHQPARPIPGTFTVLGRTEYAMSIVADCPALNGVRGVTCTFPVAVSCVKAAREPFTAAPETRGPVQSKLSPLSRALGSMRIETVPLSSLPAGE